MEELTKLREQLTELATPANFQGVNIVNPQGKRITDLVNSIIHRIENFTKISVRDVIHDVLYPVDGVTSAVFTESLIGRVKYTINITLFDRSDYQMYWYRVTLVVSTKHPPSRHVDTVNIKQRNIHAD